MKSKDCLGDDVNGHRDGIVLRGLTESRKPLESKNRSSSQFNSTPYSRACPTCWNFAVACGFSRSLSGW